MKKLFLLFIISLGNYAYANPTSDLYINNVEQETKKQLKLEIQKDIDQAIIDIENKLPYYIESIKKENQEILEKSLKNISN